MSIPVFLGMPLHIWVGILLFLLILFQVAVGIKFIKIPFVWHKRTAYLIVLLGLLHGFIGIGLWFGLLSIK